MRKNGLAHFWRLYPVPKRSMYYECLIFDTRENMHRFMKKVHCFKEKRTVAQVSSMCEKGNPDFVGTMFFYDGGYGAGVVAHEMVHAATFFIAGFRKRKIDILNNMEHNETLCYMVSDLVAQFWIKYWRYRRKGDHA